MKKLFASLLVLAATLNAFAITYTAKAKIVMKSGNGQSSTLYLIQSDDLTDGVNASYCGPIEMEGLEIALYATYKGVNYESFGSKDLSELTYGIKTNSSDSYTFTVSKVEGSETIVWKDGEGNDHALTEGASWTMTKAQVAAGFTTETAATPATPEICHRYGKLEVRGTAGQTVQVLNLDGTATSIADQVMATDNETIDLSGLAAEKEYLVKWNGKELIISTRTKTE